MIYLIEAVGSGRIKIGFAKSVETRIRSIDTSCPFEIRLLSSREGCRLMESAMHRAQSLRRVKGEWFIKWDECIEWFEGFTYKLHLPDHTKDFVHEINAFCKKNGIPDSRFGREAMNNPAFIYALRKGGDIQQSTVNKLRAFMESYKPK